MFVNKKISETLRIKEVKPPIVNQHECVVYKFQCDSCDSNYVGYTARHLHQRTLVFRNWQALNTAWTGQETIEDWAVTNLLTFRAGMKDK